jgi:FixJ family two-component response regulator
MKAQLLISVIDDDLSVRESLPELLKELGFTARTFP